MKNGFLFCFVIVALLFSSTVKSQVFIGPGYYAPRYHTRPYRSMRQQTPVTHFNPYVELSGGYAFPNLDKTLLPDYNGEYHNTATQTGPFAGALNYRFSQRASIGLLVTHGMVQAPYYNANGASPQPDFNVKLNNWAFMVNLVNYLPGNTIISPYTRVALGVNSWQQNATDGNGNKLPMQNIPLPDLAYQLSLGAKFKLSKNTGFFMEAGYGKYILQAGLTVKL